MKEKINQFCKKIEAMAHEISTNNIGLPFQTSGINASTLVIAYKAALELYSTNDACSAVLERLFTASENLDIQSVLAEASESEIQVLSNFAETFVATGKIGEAAKLFQFLTLLCPNGAPYPHTYLRLAETLAALNIDVGTQLYDFILTVFPNDPFILFSAAKCYYSDERPKRALRVLSHAKEICERHSESNPELQKFFDLILPEFLKIQGEVEAKK